jgi:hypothetical protein
VSQASPTGTTMRAVGDVLTLAAIVIALVNNDSIQWAIGVPIVLAIAGVGLRIEAVISRSRLAACSGLTRFLTRPHTRPGRPGFYHCAGIGSRGVL